MNSHTCTYGYTELHKYKADAHTHKHTHTFHPTCSVNREQDVADIWVHEQTRDAPRKREIEGEQGRRDGREKEREG